MHILNLTPDKQDERDYHFSKVVNPHIGVTLPAKIDLRLSMPPVYDQGDLGSCHDDHTSVLTSSGWKLFKDITLEDYLASADPDSKKMIYEKPTNLTNYQYDGDMYYSDHSSLDFALTPNHKMLVRKWNQKERTLNSDYEFVEIKDLGWYTGLMTNINYDGIDDSLTYILPEIEHKRINCRNARDVDMKYWLMLLGIYLAEGTMAKDENHYKFQITASTEKEKDFIKDVLDNLGLHYLELDDRFTFGNKQIYLEYQEYGLLGVKSFDKYVPDFVFNLSSDNIKYFLLGHFMGDGCQSKNNRMFYTSSEAMASQIQTLIFLSGGWSNISTRPPRTSQMKDGRVVTGKHNENCVIEWSTPNLSLDRKMHIKVDNYSGMVYCAEVPTYHTLVTKRNGKILISGNCTANAGVANRVFLTGNNDLMLSRLFLYYEERALENTIPIDNGASMRDICKALANTGVSEESYDPYVIEKFASTPTLEAVTNAAKYKISTYHALKTVADIRSCLALTQKPVLMGMKVYESFESAAVAKTGKMTMPKAKEQMLGGHAVLAVGYDDSKKVLIVRNSWGADWGDKGYFYMPYDYVAKGYASDFWVIS